MQSRIIIRLPVGEKEQKSLEGLQRLFAEVCTCLWDVVRESRCWNRVALHHLAYHGLRAKYPEMGSQMLCNAIYSVCRVARAICQGASSPWNVAQFPARSIPRVVFSAFAPVYFDRHTLSIKNGQFSMYSLEGRLRFGVALPDEEVSRFQREKVKEIVLARDVDGYFLAVEFGSDSDLVKRDDFLPEYVVVQE